MRPLARWITASFTLALLAVPPAAACTADSGDAAHEAPARSGSPSPASPSERGPSRSTTSGPELQRAVVPPLVVRRKVTGLDHPWDVRPIGTGRLLFTQRDRATVSVWEDGAVRRVDGFRSGDVWVSGETGLMGLEVDPAFTTNHRFYTCQGGTRSDGSHDVRVLAWRLDAAARNATFIRKLIGGFPATSGRHGGCRLLVTRDGSLLVGTGDSAVGTVPENKRSLGGKTLRLNRFTGAPWPKNPFIHAANRNKRYVQTYGHRNVQGVAQRADGSLWSVEQGTYRDDEVNRLRNGGDYGYNPVPGYNETVPMTDFSLPGRQYGARWRSGDPTLATSGGTFVSGSAWGALNGTFAIAALKASRVLFLTFDGAGKLQRVRQPAALQEYGRLRTVVDGPGAVLYIPTDNGGGNDVILSVRPGS